MRKFILVIIILTGFGLRGFAQEGKLGSFSFGIDGAVPVKAESQIFNAGIGGSLRYDYQIKPVKHLYVGLSAGFESFALIKGVENPNTPSNYNYVPLKASLKYYPIWGFFGEIQAGEVIYTQHGGGHAFDTAPGIGYSFKKGFEMGMRYEEWKQTPENHITGQYGQTGPFSQKSTFGQIALHLAVRF